MHHGAILSEGFKSGSMSHWETSPDVVTLGKDEIHVWRAGLDVESRRVGKLQQLLSDNERERAERFYFEKDRNRFIVARGLLRSILGRYLDTEPSHLKFSYGPYGKPSLAGELAGHTIRFNLSHSEDLALYAIAVGREIGVDVEQIRPDFSGPEIAERFFSPREASVLFALPQELRVRAFFDCWTRKEAYIKARGEGLTLPLDSFDVSLVPGEPAALLYASGDPKELSRWSLQELDPGSSYAAALAAEGRDWELKCWQWPGQFG